jgi:5-formyltetrahydrofolate cyclo-ligase
MNHSLNSPPNQKRRLRAEMRALRQGNSGNTPTCFQALSDVFVGKISLPQDAIISGYCAFGEEINPEILLNHLREQGHVICLPVVEGKGQPLSFHRYEPGDALRPNSMGILEPLPTVPKTEPEVVLVPLLAFDAVRNRLGYGGGFYDRTISALRAYKTITAIGVGYSYQEIANVPIEPHDVQLDKIVTELKVF